MPFKLFTNRQNRLAFGYPIHILRSVTCLVAIILACGSVTENKSNYAVNLEARIRVNNSYSSFACFVTFVLMYSSANENNGI